MIETAEQYLRTLHWATKFRLQALELREEHPQLVGGLAERSQALIEAANSQAESLEQEAKEYEQRNGLSGLSRHAGPHPPG